MPSVAYGSGAYRRANGSFPEIKLVNMFVEQAQTSENQVALLSRPGLGLYFTVGAGPINGIYQRADLFAGDIFTISGDTVYKGIVSMGTINGSGAASFGSSGAEVVYTRGSTAYSYAGGAGHAAITFPDSANVTAVAYIGSLFVYARAGSGKFYWSSPLDGRTINALDFATAEREGDNLLDVRALGDNIWLFGANSIESWAHTGDADLPFTRIEQVAFDKGIHSTGAACRADNTLFFVGSNFTVYRIGDALDRISDHGIEERILASATARLFAFYHEGHEFVCLRLDTETLAYDCATQEWCEFQSSGGQWIVSQACMVGHAAILGHQTTNEVMAWSEWDDMGQELERRLTFAQQLDEPASIDRIAIWANCGQTPLLAGQGSDPTIELRLSDDAGNTWGEWEAERLGSEGEYRCVPEWRAMGLFDFPGLMGEIRVTDPVPFRLSAIKVNDQAGGRQRV